MGAWGGRGAGVLQEAAETPLRRGGCGGKKGILRDSIQSPEAALTRGRPLPAVRLRRPRASASPSDTLSFSDQDKCWSPPWPPFLLIRPSTLLTLKSSMANGDDHSFGHSDNEATCTQGGRPVNSYQPDRVGRRGARSYRDALCASSCLL